MLCYTRATSCYRLFPVSWQCAGGACVRTGVGRRGEGGAEGEEGVCGGTGGPMRRVRGGL